MPMWDEQYRRARVLIVDDQEVNLRLLTHALHDIAGLTNLITTVDPTEVEGLVAAQEPDLILLDLHMPFLDGFGVLERLNKLIRPGHYLPIMVLTADISNEAKEKALSMGARDFLTKPFNFTEVLLRIHNLLETRLLHQKLENQNLVLEQKVQERTFELIQAERELVSCLMRVVEGRDDQTGHHIERVTRTTHEFARALGFDPEAALLLSRASGFHDLGKVGIPDSILLKPDRLSDDEREQMKRHTLIGADIITECVSPLMRLAREIILTHHERWDGLGYPTGLAGEEIPLSGRVVAIVDTFDALISERPYKRAWPFNDALAEIRRGGGSHFDPVLVEVFATMMEESRRVALG
jgi:putative two-component system response regulator